MFTLEKISQILNASLKPTTKYRIIVKCKLSTKSLHYIEFLLEKGLLEGIPAANIKGLPGRKSKDRMIYQTTSKGKELLKLYNEILKLLNNPPNVNKNVGDL